MAEIREGGPEGAEEASEGTPKGGRIAGEAFMLEAKAKARERRGRRLTGDDVAAGMRARSEARAAKRAERRARPSRFDGRKVVRTSVVTAAALAALVAVAGLGASQEAHTASMADLSADLRNAEASLRAAERAADEAGTPEDLAAQGIAQAAQADEAAREVADIQQEINTLMYKAVEEGNDGAGGLAPSYVASTDLRIAVGELFEEEDLALGDDALISTDMSSGSPVTDPRVVWYVMAGDDGTTADPSAYSWAVEGIAPAKRPGSYDVIWTARTATGNDVLAWTTARYDADTGLFSDFTRGLTTIGARQALGGQR